MTTPFPKISIITPSYNQAHYLEQCILSVLEQDYPNIEYIIMDGGSTDGSVEIIKKYASRLAYWVTQKDSGQSAAINEGLRYATGEIWAWMNADDAYLPGAVSKAVEWFASHPDCGIVYGDCLMMDDYGQITGTFSAKEFNFASLVCGEDIIPTGSTFLRREVTSQIGYLDERLHFVMDMEYWFRAALVVSIDYISESLSLYRIYSQAKTWNISHNTERGLEIIQIVEQFWRRQDIPPSIFRIRAMSLSNFYLYVSDLAGQAGDWKLHNYYLKKNISLGLRGLRPRLFRLLFQMFLGKKITLPVQKLWHKLHD